MIVVGDGRQVLWGDSVVPREKDDWMKIIAIGAVTISKRTAITGNCLCL